MAVQRQRRLWLRLIVANPGPILTIRRGAHDGVANVVAGVAMLTPCIFAFVAAVLVDHVLFSQAHSSKDRYWRIVLKNSKIAALRKSRNVAHLR